MLHKNTLYICILYVAGYEIFHLKRKEVFTLPIVHIVTICPVAVVVSVPY